MTRRPICLLFANTARYLHHYRGGLIRRLVDDGWQVVLLSPPEKRSFIDDFESWGASWQPVSLKPGSTNPLAEMSSIARLVRVYRNLRPDLAHHFTPKGVIYGSVASRLSRTPVVINAVTGLGHVFTDSGVGARVLRPAVRIAYRFVLDGRGHRVVVQNDSDRTELARIGASDTNRTILIRGSGVNLNRFTPNTDTGRSDGGFRLLFAARLLREKGLIELVDAVESLVAAGLDITLACAGEVYPGNPSSLTVPELGQLRALPFFEDLGYVDDMPRLIDSIDAVALPTYREGASRLLMEAGAMGKPVISTQIPGNEGLVIDGRTGILVPPREVDPLRVAILTLMNDRDLCKRYGEAGREHVAREFSEEVVVERTMAVYDDAMEEARAAGRLCR